VHRATRTDRQHRVTVGPFASQHEPTAVSISDLQSRHTAVASVPSGVVGVQVSNTP
jgi:hypothetical protein